MKTRRGGILIFLSLAICFSGGMARGEFKAGVAVCTVTPHPLLPVVGGIGPAHAVSNKAGDLQVTGLVLAQRSNVIAIVTADFLGFPAVLGNKVRQRVRNIAPSNVLISATHTHSAPDCYGFPDDHGGTSADAAYLEHVCEAMVEAIGSAATNLQVCEMKIGTGDAQGKIAYNAYAEQLYDPRCSVVQFITRDHLVLATLINYAIHPEVIGSAQGLCSPDLVGPLRDRIREKGGGTCLFLNGAQGGMVTADNRRENGEEVRTWSECQRIGVLLADESLRIVQSAASIPDPQLWCGEMDLTLPIDNPAMRNLIRMMPAYRGQDSDKIVCQVNLINLGPAQILTIPGEALPNIGFYLKRKMRGKHNLLFGLTNDAFGYILAREDYDSFARYRYISRTSLGERTGTIFVDQALRFIQSSPVPQNAP